MSNDDRSIVKAVRRVVRASLEKALDDLVERATSDVVETLQRDYGGDRLYIPTAEAAIREDRDARIRADFRALAARHSERVALEMLALRVGLSVKQLKRICSETAGTAD